MTRSLVWFLLVAAAGTWAHAQAIDIPLVYSETLGDDEFYPPNGCCQIPLQPSPPDGVKGIDATGKKSLYGTVALGSRIRALVLVIDKFDAALILDANGNKDLGDDPSSTTQVNTMPGSPDFSINWQMEGLKSEVDGHEMPMRAEFAYYSGAPNNCFLYTSGFYRGEFSAGGKKYTFLLSDANANGVHGDIFGSDLDGDVFLVGETGAVDYVSRFALGKYLSLDGVLYEVTTTPGAPKVTLTPSKSGDFDIALPVETQRLQLLDKKAGLVVSCYRPGKRVPAPQGDYTIDSYQLVRKDDAGALWTLEAGAGKSSIRVGDGKKVVYGEPFQPSIELIAGPTPGKAELEFSIKGAGGETVGWLERLTPEAGKIEMSAAKPSRPVEPMYRVVTPDGEVAAQGSFEYG